MNLQEAMEQIDLLADDHTIFVRKPWTAHSEAVVSQLDAGGGTPSRLANKGFDCFLEVSLAKEALGVFENKSPTAEDRVALVLYYAENDAYPSWVYEP